MKTVKHITLFMVAKRWAPVCCGVLVATAWIAGCKKNLYQPQLAPTKLVVLAEIIAGDTANIPITASQPAGSGTTILFQKLQAVTASISGQDGSQQSLVLNNSPLFTTAPTAIYSGNQPFKANTLYTLAADYSTLGNITATTSIPNSFVADNMESGNDTSGGRPRLSFHITLHDAGNEKNYYFFEAVKQLVQVKHYFTWQGITYDYDTPAGFAVYQQVMNNPGVFLVTDTLLLPQYLRLPLYTRDSRTANASIGSLDSPYSRIFITDSLFNGRSYSVNFQVAADLFVAPDYTQLGIVRIQIKNASRELYTYLLQNESYNSTLGAFPVSNLSSPAGNIQNGLGIFGSSYRQQYSFYYDSLR